MSYRNALTDSRWRRRRFEIMKRDSFKCRRCEFTPGRGLAHICSPNRLEVHHIYYKAGLRPWEYSSDALITLCKDCHIAEGEKPTLIRPEGIKRSSFEEWRVFWIEQQPIKQENFIPRDLTPGELEARLTELERQKIVLLKSVEREPGDEE